jgi:hypothetical protein
MSDTLQTIQHYIEANGTEGTIPPVAIKRIATVCAMSMYRRFDWSDHQSAL